jgi:hypothetical protein
MMEGVVAALAGRLIQAGAAEASDTADRDRIRELEATVAHVSTVMVELSTRSGGLPRR